MKTFKKSYLPDTVNYNGYTLKLNMAETSGPNGERYLDRHRIRAAEDLKSKGVTVCLVACMSNNLKGKTDLHGQPYKPNLYIFSDLSTPEEIQDWRAKVDFWKKLFTPRTKQYIKGVAARERRKNSPEIIYTEKLQAIKELLNN